MDEEITLQVADPPTRGYDVLWSWHVARTRLLRRLKMFDTRIAWHARHSESRELADDFLLPLFSSDFRPCLREDILCVVTRCALAAPRRLKMFSRRTGTSLPKCRIASVASPCFHEHTALFLTFWILSTCLCAVVLNLDPQGIVFFFQNTLRTLEA